MIWKKKHYRNATAATVTSLIATGNVQGVIHHFDTANAFSLGFGSAGSVPWDIDGEDGGNEARFITVVEEDIELVPVTSNFSFVKLGNGGARSNALNNLTLNYPVSSAGKFRYQPLQLINAQNGTGDDSSTIFKLGSVTGWTSGVSGYFGFRFDDQGQSGTNTVYGWARLTIVLDDLNSEVTLHEWAYEDSGGAIQVGAVPEPAAVTTGLGALALGAAGLRRWRKAKRGV